MLLPTNITVHWQEEGGGEGGSQWLSHVHLLADIYSYQLEDDRIFRLGDPLIQVLGLRCEN